MGLEVAVFAFFIFFQLIGAAALARQSLDGRRAPALILAGLLVLNATLAALDLLRVTHADGATFVGWLQVVDAPTAGLLFAFLAARRGRRDAAIVFAGAGVALAVAALLAPSFWLGRWPTVAFVQVPYYVALAAVTWTLSKGSETDRWIALAFIARPFFFLFQLLPLRPAEVLDDPIERAMALLNDATVVLTALVHLVAAARLLRGGEGPTRTVVLAILLVGPLDAIAYELTPPGALVPERVLNYATLAFVRPLLLYIAFVPARAWRLLARAAFVSGVAAAANAGALALGFGVDAALVVGAGLGALALALLELDPLPSGRMPARAAPVRDRPRTFLLQLRGSSEGPALAAWTQRGIVEATGIPAQRVSELPGVLNRDAATWIETHAPTARQPEAKLVTTHRGLVSDRPGIWVYYRLTSAGEAVARALAEAEAGPRIASSHTVSVKDA